MSEIKKFLDKEGVRALWTKVYNEFSSRDQRLATIEAAQPAIPSDVSDLTDSQGLLEKAQSITLESNEITAILTLYQECVSNAQPGIGYSINDSSEQVYEDIYEKIDQVYNPEKKNIIYMGDTHLSVLGKVIGSTTEHINWEAYIIPLVNFNEFNGDIMIYEIGDNNVTTYGISIQGTKLSPMNSIPHYIDNLFEVQYIYDQTQEAITSCNKTYLTIREAMINKEHIAAYLIDSSTNNVLHVFYNPYLIDNDTKIVFVGYKDADTTITEFKILHNQANMWVTSEANIARIAQPTSYDYNKALIKSNNNDLSAPEWGKMTDFTFYESISQTLKNIITDQGLQVATTLNIWPGIEISLHGESDKPEDTTAFANLCNNLADGRPCAAVMNNIVYYMALVDGAGASSRGVSVCCEGVLPTATGTGNTGIIHCFHTITAEDRDEEVAVIDEETGEETGETELVTKHIIHFTTTGTLLKQEDTTLKIKSLRPQDCELHFTLSEDPQTNLPIIEPPQIAVGINSFTPEVAYNTGFQFILDVRNVGFKKMEPIMVNNGNLGFFVFGVMNGSPEMLLIYTDSTWNTSILQDIILPIYDQNDIETIAGNAVSGAMTDALPTIQQMIDGAIGNAIGGSY